MVSTFGKHGTFFFLSWRVSAFKNLGLQTKQNQPTFGNVIKMKKCQTCLGIGKFLPSVQHPFTSCDS